MTKINSYAELCGVYPWLDGMMRNEQTRGEAVLLIYLHGGCDEWRRIQDQLGIRQEIEAWMDEEARGNA